MEGEGGVEELGESRGGGGRGAGGVKRRGESRCVGGPHDLRKHSFTLQLSHLTVSKVSVPLLEVFHNESGDCSLHFDSQGQRST